MSIKPNMQQQVLEKIRNGEISMRPRLYFVLQVALVGILSILTLILSLFVLSFIFFSVRESGQQFLLGFGQRGLTTLITLFPWTLTAVVVMLLLSLEWLVRTFRFAYRVSVLRIFLTLMAVALLGSMVVAATPLHSFLLDKADHDSLPFLGGIYEQIHDPHTPEGVFRGIVSSTTDETLIISHDDTDKDTDDGTWVIVPPPGFDPRQFPEGTRVYVGGEKQNGVVHAYGIKTFSPER